MPLWISQETLDLMKERDKAKTDAVSLTHSGYDASQAWIRFKQLRNQINNKRKNEEQKFKASCIKKSLNSSSDTWQTAKLFMGWQNSGGPPSQLSCEGKLVTRAFDIAMEMNQYFISKVSKIRESIVHVPTNFTACKNIMRGKSCTLSLQHVTVSKVNKLLKNLKTSKSCGIDQLDNFCVKIAENIID